MEAKTDREILYEKAIEVVAFHYRHWLQRVAELESEVGMSIGFKRELEFLAQAEYTGQRGLVRAVFCVDDGKIQKDIEAACAAAKAD